MRRAHLDPPLTVLPLFFAVNAKSSSFTDESQIKTQVGSLLCLFKSQKTTCRGHWTSSISSWVYIPTVIGNVIQYSKLTIFLLIYWTKEKLHCVNVATDFTCPENFSLVSPGDFSRFLLAFGSDHLLSPFNLPFQNMYVIYFTVLLWMLNWLETRRYSAQLPSLYKRIATHIVQGAGDLTSTSFWSINLFTSTQNSVKDWRVGRGKKIK